MKMLIVKRFWTFIRRYILALIILIFPFVSEAIIAALIPTQTNIINSIRGTVSTNGAYELSLKNYSKQTIPVYVDQELNFNPNVSLISSIKLV
jgi:hypothetical protein